MKITSIIAVGLAGVFSIVGAGAQIPASPDEAKAKCGSQIRSTYLLGPDDQLEISGPELSDLPNKPVRIDGEGDIQVPLVGRIHVAGLTVQQTEQELNSVLSKYIRKPQVVVGVAEVRSQPVSIRRSKHTGGAPGTGTQDVIGDASAGGRDPARCGVQRPNYPPGGVGMHSIAEDGA